MEQDTLRIIKTVKMSLMAPTNRKCRRILKAMQGTQQLQDHTAKMAWSFDRRVWASGYADAWQAIVKRFNHRLPYASAQETVDVVRQALKSFQSNGYSGNKPRFRKATHIYFKNPQPKFKVSPNGNYVVSLPLKKGRKNNREHFVLNIGDYQEEYLEELEAENIKKGSAKLIRKEDRFELHQSIRKKVPKTESPDYFVGIDLGETDLAAVSVINRNGDKVTALPPWKGGFLKNHSSMVVRIRRALQENGFFGQRLSSNEKRWVDNQCHQISREIIDSLNKRLPGTFPRYQVCMEDLTDIRKNLNKKVSKQRKKLLNSWPFNKLQSFIKYKAEEDSGCGIQFVEPAFTSRLCSNCGALSKTRQNSERIFKCEKCGYQVHRDINAGFRIALRGLSS